MALPLLSGGVRIFCVRCPSPSSLIGIPAAMIGGDEAVRALREHPDPDSDDAETED